MSNLKDDFIGKTYAEIYNIVIGTTGTFQYPKHGFRDGGEYMFRLNARAANGGVIFVAEEGNVGEGFSVGDTGWVDGQFASGSYVLWGDTTGDILEVWSKK